MTVFIKIKDCGVKNWLFFPFGWNGVLKVSLRACEIEAFLEIVPKVLQASSPEALERRRYSSSASAKTHPLAPTSFLRTDLFPEGLTGGQTVRSFHGKLQPPLPGL